MLLLRNVLLFVFFICGGQAAKILLAPFAVYSQVNQMTTVGEELINLGHEVHCMIPGYKSLPKTATEKGIKPVYYGPGKNEKPFMFDSEEFTRDTFEKNLNGTSSIISAVINLGSMLFEMADAMMHQEVYEKIRKEKFDFALVTGVQIFRFPLIIPHRLGIPFASITVELPTDLFSSLIRLPSIDPSFESISTDHGSSLGFSTRVKNVISYLMFSYAFPMMTGFDQKFQHLSPEKPFSSLKDLAAKSSVWIVDRSSLLGLPLPSASNVFYVDCVSTVLPKPLPTDLQKIADSAKGGLVVVSFGSTIAYLHHRHLDKLALAFKELSQYTFILRTKTKLTVPIPSNLKILPWIPQNDLLGHKNTVLFITHCGNAGTHEGIANGVPLLGLPIQGDQKANAAMFTARGYGRALSLNDITPKDVIEAVKDVATNPVYKNNVKKASTIMRADPLRPNRKAANIIDHVIKFGDEHLKGTSSSLYWYEILMFDMFVVFEIIVIALAYVGYRMCKRCCGSKTKRKSKRD